MKNDMVVVILDRPRVLKFNHTALKMLVALTGKDLGELDEEIKPDNFELIEKLAFCGLQKDAKDSGETLTIERTIELLDEAPVYTESLKKIFAAWSAAFGVQSEGNQQQPVNKPPAADKNSTGRKASK